MSLKFVIFLMNVDSIYYNNINGDLIVAKTIELNGNIKFFGEYEFKT